MRWVGEIDWCLGKGWVDFCWSRSVGLGRDCLVHNAISMIVTESDLLSARRPCLHSIRLWKCLVNFSYISRPSLSPKSLQDEEEQSFEALAVYSSVLSSLSLCTFFTGVRRISGTLGIPVCPHVSTLSFLLITRTFFFFVFFSFHNHYHHQNRKILLLQLLLLWIRLEQDESDRHIFPIRLLCTRRLGAAGK